MKVLRLSSILHSIKSHFGLRNSLRVSSYSTTTAISERSITLTSNKWSHSVRLIYRKISPIGNPTVSIVPVLEQWVQDGEAIDKETLQVMIKELRTCSPVPVMLPTISNGGKLDEFSWYYLAKGYLHNNQPKKPVEKMKEAIAVCHKRWKPDKEVVAACLEYFRQEGEEAGNFINLLEDKNIILVDVQDSLLNNFLHEEPNLDALSELNGDDALVGDGEALFRA
ncbi:hypothetical protein Dsin_007762 [Dipteronia sinensis]|uniref:Uncharacterized protein n=1 Tax=Dipteronia sinensis TaxID=43782 RepID=A0AAE0B277_9ROSI|nr:hypothetical protein Dsin_007762 [Dipteronia sinensis]